MSASLVELNKLVENEHGVYVHPAAQKDFAYSDGSETEQYLRKVLKQSSDLSSYSVELKSHIRDWGSEYHLTPLRANLLRGFDLSSCKRILELGCGCGAITRYLGEQGAAVDSIEGSPVRAELAALRCKDLKNVTISTGNFNDFEFSEGAYDLVLYVGVTEYAGRFSEGLTDEQALQSLLQRAKSSISDDGVVMIAIENRTGLKYVMGANEDHYAEPYIGISDYPQSAGIRTYSYGEWQTQLSMAGLPDNQVLYPFPDYKIPDLVISEEFAAKHKYASNLLEGTNSRDYLEYLDMGGREMMLWRAACEGGYLGQVANSYLILAAKSPQAIRKLAAPDFAHLPKFNRRPEYCTLAKKPAGLDEVHREFIDLDAAQRSGSIDGVTHEPDSVESYFDGPLLSVIWSRALLAEKHFDEFEQYVRDYFTFLQHAEKLNPDLLPSNIVLVEGQYKVIDKEWRTEWAVFPELLLYRAIIIFVSSYRSLLVEYSVSRRLVNTLDLVLHCFELVGKPLGRKMLDDVIEKDTLLQRVASPEPILMDMEASFLQRMNSRHPDLAVYWRRNEADFVPADRVVVTAGSSKTRQTVALTLPAEANELQFIRFDPCSVFWEELAGFFRLSRVSLFATNGETKELVWQYEGEDNVADAVREFHGMRFERASFGSGYYLFEEDAWLEFHVNPRRRLSKNEHYVFEADMVFPRSREAIIIGDRYSLASELIEGKLASIADINQHYQDQYLAASHELNEIKRSRVWRYAETYRDVVHRRFIPRLIRGYLQICRPYKAIQKHGINGLAAHLKQRYSNKPEPEVIVVPLERAPNNYEAWLKSRPVDYWSSPDELNSTPLVSILMPVFDLAPELLHQAVASVINQVYPEWELCIVDDCSKNQQTLEYLRALNNPRIKVHFSEQNENISLASNHAAGLATGEYITLLDHDDVLAPHALLELVLEAQKGADFVYSDEDFLISDGELENPHFKPDYSPDLLLSQNYITHMVLITSELFNKVGRFRESYDGAQDYDLFLRVVEQAKKISHVAKPLYHWRMIETSTAMNPEVKPEAHENARSALKDALARRGEPSAEVLDGNKMHYFRVRRPIQGEPLVSIIIPLKDKPWLLTKCIHAIQLQSSYENYEIICVSNDSASPILYEALENFSKQDARIRMLELNQGFNFSRVVNTGVEQAKGEHILLLNNDIEVLSGDWIESLLEHSQRADVAAVGGKLFYPDNTIQHAGIVHGLGGYAGHIHKNFPAYHEGYFNRLQLVQNVTAVTGALLMVKRSIYQELGGFDEDQFAVAYNDVDFCIRAREAGYLNIFTPYCEAYHFESKSRGYEVTTDKASRFSREMANFRARHLGSIEKGDPYHNPNFDKRHDDYRY
jgi:GT2 family glycosyltransferase/SAM-dependent methyltransferase